MVVRVSSILLLCTSLILAKPATKPVDDHAAKPATKPADNAKIPSPAELLAKIQQEKAAKKALAQVAYIELDRPVLEKPADFTPFGEPGLTAQSVVARINQARDDKEVKAILVTLGSTEFNISQASEIRDALADAGKAGKKVFVYADSFETDDYILASGATDICMIEGGEIMIPGVGLNTMFAKGLMDKVGVKADYVQIGEYKGADEEYTRTEPSKELRGEMNKLVGSLYAQIVSGIAQSRKLDPKAVEAIVDQTLITGKAAKAAGLVDHLIDIDGLRDLIAKSIGKEIDLVHDYGIPEREHIDFSNPFAIFQMFGKKPEPSDKPAVAMIFADGVIVDGDGGGDMFSDEKKVGSDDIRKALRIAQRDDTIKVIVLRIDSPGGSALASEVMWQAVRRVAKDKPVIISVGGMAASGGYYLASAGDRIFADPTSIVGSIGVVGGKFVTKELYDKLGLHTENFTKGKNAALYSSDEPWSPQQREMVTKWMKETYDLFTERVMSSRKGKIKDIDQVAKGRIFAAKEAKELGMVDELGGVQDAIKYAADAVDLKSGEYEVRVVPAPKTLIDIVRGNIEDTDAKMPFKPQMSIASSPLLKSLSPGNARMLVQQIQILQLLQRKPFMLVSPYIVNVR